LRRRILVRGSEFAEQRQNVHVIADVAQHALHSPDFARARQEHQRRQALRSTLA
jgi:hypothetical protein